MPFALIIIGLVLVITGYQNTYGQLGSQLKSDITGSGNFLYWVVAIGVVGAIGYVPAFKNPSRLFLFLILLSFVLKNGGVFSKLSNILSNTNDALVGGSTSTNQSSSGAWVGGVNGSWVEGSNGGLSASGIGSQVGAGLLGSIGSNIGQTFGGSSGQQEGSAYGTAVGGLVGAAAGSEYGQ